jgi:hypothetical protein
MKKGQFITIGEGDYAGQSGIITFIKDETCIVAIGPSVIEIPLEYISTEDEVRRIWMIYGEPNASTPANTAVFPRIRYLEKEAAVSEMDRLGRKHPGKSFLLLESVAELTYEMALTKKERSYNDFLN